MALPSWISTHRGDAVRSTFWLVKLGLASPLYLTDCDQPIVYDTHTFTPTLLTVDGMQSDSSSSAGNGGRLALASGGTYWQPLLAAIAGGLRTFDVSVWEAWLDVAALPSPAPPANAVRLAGVTRVEAAEWDSEWLALTLGPSADPALGRLPFREYSTACTYRKYKGAQCGYTGSETTCDRTWATCLARGNNARFGGFVDIVSKDEVPATWNWQTGSVDYTGTVMFRPREV